MGWVLACGPFPALSPGRACTAVGQILRGKLISGFNSVIQEVDSVVGGFRPAVECSTSGDTLCAYMPDEDECVWVLLTW